MAQHQRKHHRKRRRVRFPKLYGLLSALLIVAAVVAGCIVFFKVDQVVVEGNQRYTQEELVAATGIQQGDNMFLLNKFDVIDAMQSELTYLDTVTIRRSLPSTVRVIVTEYTVAAALQDAGTDQWWLISSSGKLLERVDEPGDYLQVTGLELAAPSEGTFLVGIDDQRLQQEALLAILPSLETRGMLDEAQSIDLSAGGQVSMGYANRLTVRMNLSSDFDYQMRVLATVMEDYVLSKWSDTDTGVLDMTLDDGLPHLIRDAS